MNKNQDHIAEAIADYQAMSDENRGELLVRILEDQPVLMGFVTNLADDFNDSQHEALVDAVVILINAFVARGIVVEMVPQQIVEEVVREKVDVYEEQARDQEEVVDVVDSPLVYEDLRNYVLFRSNLSKEDIATRNNFGMVLDTIIAIVERSVSSDLKNKKQ